MRSLVGLAVLVFFTVQAFLVQVHLHGLPDKIAPAFSATAVLQHDSKVPLNTDQCLLCQEFTHSGAYVLPAAINALPPSAVVLLLPFILTPATQLRPVSHAWNGRAPPHHI